jgi:hypothetical protein
MRPRKRLAVSGILCQSGSTTFRTSPVSISATDSRPIFGSASRSRLPLICLRCFGLWAQKGERPPPKALAALLDLPHGPVKRARSSYWKWLSVNLKAINRAKKLPLARAVRRYHELRAQSVKRPDAISKAAKGITRKQLTDATAKARYSPRAPRPFRIRTPHA